MPEAKTLNLAAKLSAIMGELGNIPKSGFNKAQQYRFVRESDVAEKLSALLAKQHIFLHQDVVETKVRELYRTQSGNTMWLTTVKVAFTWYDGETGETLPPSVFPGHGADTGDKGVYKAMTGAEKYFLMKTFLISTGDDPEADEKVDTAVAAAEAAAGPRVVRGSQKGVKRGGKSGQATAAQVAEIARLAGAVGLDAETVVPVIERVTETKPTDGWSIRDWLSSLTSEQAGSLIEALGKMSPTDEEDVPGTQAKPEAGQLPEDEEEPLSIV